MNILIIKHGSLGDLIISFGAMKTLREIIKMPIFIYLLSLIIKKLL